VTSDTHTFPSPWLLRCHNCHTTRHRAPGRADIELIVDAAAFRLVLWVLATILLPTQKVYGGPGTSLHWVGHFGADMCPWSSLSLLIFVMALAFAAVCLGWMSGVLYQMAASMRNELCLAFLSVCLQPYLANWTNNCFGRRGLLSFVPPFWDSFPYLLLPRDSSLVIFKSHKYHVECRIRQIRVRPFA
jgi:hypothetical protein